MISPAIKFEQMEITHNFKLIFFFYSMHFYQYFEVLQKLKRTLNTLIEASFALPNHGLFVTSLVGDII